MLKIYTSYNCSSCKKAMKWLDETGISYEEYNFFSKGLTSDEVKNILKYAHNGFEDVISERSAVFARHSQEIAEMTTKQLIDFIIEFPAVLKRPLIVDDVTKSIHVGYNSNDMEDLL